MERNGGKWRGNKGITIKYFLSKSTFAERFDAISKYEMWYMILINRQPTTEQHLELFQSYNGYDLCLFPYT